MIIRLGTALAFVGVLSGCGSDEVENSTATLAIPKQTPAEEARERQVNLKNLESFIAATSEELQVGMRKCQAEVEQKLSGETILMIGSNDDVIKKMQERAKEDMEAAKKDAKAYLFDTVTGSYDLCSFASGFSGRVVMTHKAYCQFQGKDFDSASVNSGDIVPEGFVYTCDGQGI
ncbi:hypothetical protein [Rhizorhapis sp. SPR117]|uniref:hypothetical protein n=1 Tax=Rhizorhapis sp. SPR117 TaxID=2912611 RepID=UPI001F2A18B4|nr:hypothetical protein [Rhizorhapis sp. SPR117]